MSSADKTAQIADAIAARMGTVPDVGRVHTWERYALEAATLKALYVVTVGGADQLRGWNIKLVKATDDRGSDRRVARTSVWVVDGVMALSDAAASELVFRRLVDDVCDALRADLSFGGLGLKPEMGPTGGVDVPRLGPVKFCGVLCHGVTITFQTRHLLNT